MEHSGNLPRSQPARRTVVLGGTASDSRVLNAHASAASGFAGCSTEFNVRATPGEARAHGRPRLMGSNDPSHAGHSSHSPPAAPDQASIKVRHTRKLSAACVPQTEEWAFSQVEA